MACSCFSGYPASMSTLMRNGWAASAIRFWSQRPRRGEIMTAKVEGVPSFTPSTPLAS